MEVYDCAYIYIIKIVYFERGKNPTYTIHLPNRDKMMKISPNAFRFIVRCVI